MILDPLFKIFSDLNAKINPRDFEDNTLDLFVKGFR